MADYSDDVEINHDGVVVAVHPIPKGATISIPVHMLGRVFHPDLNSVTLRTTVTSEHAKRWLG